jgi:hypothetical protein
MMAFNDFITSKDEAMARYLEYLAWNEGVGLDEAARRSLAHLFGQLQSNDHTYVIITAFRSEKGLQMNRVANGSLAHDVRQLGWGYTPVLGGFVETSEDEHGRPQQVRVHEESLFVAAGGDARQIKARVIGLLQKYQQEAALLKLPGETQALLLSHDGATSGIGQWKADPHLMATYYTRMRKGPRNRQFTFEAAGDDSNMTRLAVETFFRCKN